VGGSSLPSVESSSIPTRLTNTALASNRFGSAPAFNANTPKGHLSEGSQAWEVGANDQLFRAADYKPLIVAYRNGSAVRVSDIGEAVDSVEDLRNSGYANNKPAVLLIIFRQPGANIIQVVDRLRATLPQLHASISPAIDMRVAMDQTTTIRASVNEVERTLVIAVVLVLLVVFSFLRNFRTTQRGCSCEPDRRARRHVPAGLSP
jgi:multidrug efflux pump